MDTRYADYSLDDLSEERRNALSQQTLDASAKVDATNFISLWQLLD